MKKADALVPGTFLRIPLEDGSFGYGRVLPSPYFAFYDYRTATPSSDLQEIENKPILFKQAVRVFNLDRWANIGNKELEGEVAKPVVRFMQNIGDFTDCTIFDSAGMRKQASPQECIGLERAAAWEVHHIERRLLDHFMGRPNETEQHLRVQLQ